MAERGILFEFPPDTVALIDKLAGRLKLDRARVVSKALGLLDVWAEAHQHNRIVVERPPSGARGEEFEIDINS